jgi:hypothetical protein
MTVSTAPLSARSGVEVQPLPRCCTSHPDWPLLVQHLVDDFPEVSLTDIVREVRAARDATQTAGLGDDDALATGELIARHQLMLLAGRLTESARLDPEQHARGNG